MSDEDLSADELDAVRLLNRRLVAAGYEGELVSEFMKGCIKSKQVLTTWDIAGELRTGVEYDPPSICRIGSGSALFEPQSVNTIYAHGGSGKSIIMAQLAYNEMLDGNDVMWIDYEEPFRPKSLMRRFQAMNAIPDLIEKQFHWYRGERIVRWSLEQYADIAARCTLVVVDSAGEFMARQHKDTNKEGEVRQAMFDEFARELAQLGPAVVFVDHTSKGSDGKSAIGSSAKHNGLDGAAYNFVLDTDDDGNPIHFSKHEGGFAKLVCRKDRSGEYKVDQDTCWIEIRPATENKPLEILFTRQQPDSYMLGHDDAPEPQEKRVTKEDNEVAIRDLIIEVGHVPKKLEGIRILRERGFIVSGSQWREVTSRIEAERVESFMTSHSDPDD